ncbi:hypothetical protein V8E36_008791 [Tilletia maclaganii]
MSAESDARRRQLTERIIQSITDQADKHDLFTRPLIDHERLSHDARGALLQPCDLDVQDALLGQVNLLLWNSAPQQWRLYCISLSRDWMYLGTEDATFIRYIRTQPRGLRFFHQHVATQARINSYNEFIRVFHIVTGGILDSLPFDNICVAGGVVLACLTSAEFEGQVSPESDVDLFLYGITADRAASKLGDVEKTLRLNVPEFDQQYDVQRTVSAVSFVPREPGQGLRKVQVVLRLHTNPGEIIASFDRDEAAACFDGAEVYIELRCLRAIWTGYSVITAKLLALTNEHRFLKYCLRGYGSVLRSDRDDITTRKMLSEAWVRREATALSLNDPIAHRDDPPKLHLPALQSRARGYLKNTWLHNYNTFTTFTAIWDYASVSRFGQEEFVAGLSKPREYGALTSFPDYDQRVLRNNIINTSSLIMRLFRPAELPRLDTLPAHMWVCRGEGSASVMSERLNFPLLPLGLRSWLNSVWELYGHRTELTALEVYGMLLDSDGHIFEVCLWLPTLETIWQPQGGLFRFAFQTLRAHVFSSAWVLARCDYGAPFHLLGLGSLLDRARLSCNSPHSPEEDAARLSHWMDM